MDDARTTSLRSSQQLRRRSAPTPRDQHRTGVRHRSTRIALAITRRKFALGLHFIAGRENHCRSKRARRYPCHRDFAPAFYSSMVEWAEHFDAQIFLHVADRKWVMRKSPRIQFWEGTTFPLWDGLTLINCAGHFEGGTVLHWPAGASGKGGLLTGDIVTVAQDRRYVSFMRSYPNLIPLGAKAIYRIVETIEPFPFDQIYGGWWKANVLSDAKAVLARSAERYLHAIAGR